MLNMEGFDYLKNPEYKMDNFDCNQCRYQADNLTDLAWHKHFNHSAWCDDNSLTTGDTEMTNKTNYTNNKQRNDKPSPWILVQVHEFDGIEGETLGHICTFQIRRKNLRVIKKILREALNQP
jgi:hypothetical protein